MENDMNSALGITDILIDAINKKYDGLRDLNSLKVNISEEDFEEMNPVIDSIIEDENNHIGKLQQLVDLLSGGTDEIEEGRAETIEIIDTGNSVVESITTMKKKLILSENFDNVIDDVQAVADPVFVGANEEHDENKKKYEDAIEENKKEAEETVPKEGDTGEKVKSKALKQMHLSEKLFDEELNSNFAQSCANNISEYILTEFTDLKNSEIRQVLRIVMDHFRGSDFDESLNEDLSFNEYSDFNSAIYNAITDVMFSFRDSNVSKSDLEKALEWFNIHFWEENGDEFETRKFNHEEGIYEESLTSISNSKNKEELKKFIRNNKDKVEGFTEKRLSEMDLNDLQNIALEIENEINESLNEARTSDQNKELLKIIASDLGDEEKLKKIKSYISSIEEALNEARTSEQNKKILSILASDDSDEDKLKKIEKYLKSMSESLNESIQYSIAKEQIKRFTEGKMPKNWNVDSYLTKLTEKKHINKKEAKSLKEWYSKIK